FLDPTSGDEKATLTTTVAPINGWGALAVRADKGDLLGCANVQDATGTHAIYTIAYNALVPGAGTTAPLFAVPSNGAPVCDGLAWDQSTDTIFKTEKQTSGSITAIKQYSSPTGTLLATLPVSFSCVNGSGLALAGGGLLLSCSDGIHFLDKTTGVEKI